MKTPDMRILLHSGEYFYFNRPHECEFKIEDIAHALSMICRYGGHCPQFYSVAQHSVAVSHHVPKELALDGLLHDATEAFLGDVTKPLKELLPDYKKLEDDLGEIIAERFGLKWPMPKEVKQIDIAMLATEQRYLFRNEDKWFGVTEKPLNYPIMLRDPRSAKTLFLERFQALTQSKAA